MAKITKIKASDSPRKEEMESEPAITRKKVVVKDKKSDKTKRKEIRAKEKAVKSTVEKLDKNESEDGGKSAKKPFILFRPFVALFCYIRDAWREIRQVRWPNRKATWKMVLAVLVYTALFVLFISLLDMFFGWLFNLILSK